MAIKVIFFDLGATLIDTTNLPGSWTPSARELITELGGSAIRIGVLSNTGNLNRAQLASQLLPANFDFGDFETDLVLLSSETGIEKPAVSAFALAVTAATATDASLQPGEILFCGEDAIEVLAAQQAGMRGLRVVPLSGDSAFGSLTATLSAVGNL